MIALVAGALGLLIAAILLRSAWRGARALIAFLRVPSARLAGLSQHVARPRLRVSGRLRANSSTIASMDGTPCVALEAEGYESTSTSAREIGPPARQTVPAVLSDGEHVASLELDGAVLHVGGKLHKCGHHQLPAALRANAASMGASSTSRYQVTEYPLPNDVDVVVLARVTKSEPIAAGYRSAPPQSTLGGQGTAVEIWTASSAVLILKATICTLMTVVCAIGLVAGAWAYASFALAEERVESALGDLELLEGTPSARPPNPQPPSAGLSASPRTE